MSAIDREALCLRWIADNLTFFAPPGILAEESKCKALLELVVLMVFRLREGWNTEPNSTAIVDCIDGHASSGFLRDKPVRTANQLVLRAGVCALMALADRRGPLQERAIQRAIDSGLIQQTERLPHHVMIERTVLDWGGFSHTLPSLSELTRTSLLVRNPDALFQTVRSAYELTHDILFGYTFGERTDSELADPERQRLRRVLTDDMVRFQREGHWDLVGELLMCWDTMKFEHDEIYHAGWRAFESMQHEDGSVPAMRRPEDPPPEQQSPKERFNERYHTTLVMAFALTTRRRREQGTVVRSHLAPNHGNGSVAERDGEWLMGLVNRADPGRAPTVLVSALVGLSLLESTDPSLSNAIREVATRIKDTVLLPTQLSGVPATLTLCAHGLLRDRDIHVPVLSGFVDAIAAVVEQIDADPATARAWCEKRVALTQLELSDPPTLPTRDEVWLAIDSGGDISTVWQLAVGCTGYGTSPPPALSDADRVGLRRLEALGVDALRRHDLITGCALLRGAHLLQPLHDERLRSVTAFLHAQQCLDGGYGRFDPAVLEVQTSENPQLDMEIDVRLPVSLAVWWALAELNTDLRLLVRKPVGRVAVRR